MAPKRGRMADEPPCKEVEFYYATTKRSGTRIKCRTVGVSNSPKRQKRPRRLDLSAPPLPLPQAFPSSAGPSQWSSPDVGDLSWADEGTYSVDYDFSPPPKTKKRS